MPRRKSTHVDDPVEVGRRLREARERAGLSQRQLSFPGCSPAYISRIEAGDRIPSLQLLREMGRRLGVSEDYLATGSERHDENAVLVEAEISLRLDEREEAARLYGEALEQATTSDEQARALAGLGQLAYREGKPREAIARLEEARSVGARRSRRPPGLGGHARPRLRVGRPARRRDQPLRELAQVGRGAQRRGRGDSLRGAARERADRQDGLRRRRAAARPRSWS